MNRLPHVLRRSVGFLLLLPSVGLLSGFGQEPDDSDDLLAGFPPGEGREIVLVSCNSCHEMAPYMRDKQPEKYWKRIVIEMMDEGAPVDFDQVEVLVRYLSNFSGHDAFQPPEEDDPEPEDFKSATVKDLVEALEIDQKLAKRIVTYRDKAGVQSLDDLKKIKGVTPELAKRIASKFRFSANE